jgi:uncharacterized phage protein (TIGR02216 family)
MRLCLHHYHLTPEAVWRLTPRELAMLLGPSIPAALSRSTLQSLIEAFPDTEKTP